ncbi:membrane-associated progesterone receptor component 1-like [Macrobrachium nipponense]|uniref:membrane-associated progesterone receptor component 1-like n=1 Tax=Macrobrachium nipponense TaxID=159736 RepID=UPI0030C86C4E
MADESKEPGPGDESFVGSLLVEIFTSPVNIALLGICVVLLYKILRSSDGNDKASGPVEPPIPKMKRQDMTLEQLKQYDGTGEHGRVCVAVNSKIFDATRGRKFYGPEKYDYIGKLLKPGEVPTEYSDDEEGSNNKTKKDD